MTMVSALVLLMAGCSTRVPRPPWPAPDSAEGYRPAQHAVHQFRWYKAGPWAVHMINTRPDACGVTFRTIKGHDRMIGREQTTSMVRRSASEAVVGINADFFSFDPAGISEGPQVANGVLLKSEGGHREALEDRRLRLQPVFAIERSGKPRIMYTRVRGNLRSGSQTLTLAGLNVRPRNDSAFVYTAFWGDSTPTDSAAIEFIIRNGLVAQVDSSARGVKIPADGAVVLARGSARTQLRLRTGDPLVWTAYLDNLEGAREVIGGYPMLLLKGRAVHHDEPGLRTTFADRRHPRAAIGIDRENRVYIVTVDGRQPGYSEGMTLQEFGDYLLAHGITDAMNLDGGGSTTLVVRGRIANRPSDQNGERAVANALLVIDQGHAGSCARKR